jgi:hypothetical protein
MSQALVQINVKFSGRSRDSDEDPADVARVIAGQPGLIWKIWLRNEEAGEGGGWYLFESRACAEDYLKGELVAKFRANPAFSEVSIKTFDIAEGLTRITRGPIDENLSNVA